MTDSTLHDLVTTIGIDLGKMVCSQRHRGARISGTDALTPTPVRAHATRTDSGRPSSSIRFRTWTPTAASVAWRRSARDRSASPITRL